MVLPLWMLRTLKMHTTHKIGLASVFLVGVVIIILDILRKIKSLGQTPFSEVAIYDIVEVTMAVVVSSIPIYRSLLSARRRKREESKSFKRPCSKGDQAKSNESDRYRLKEVVHKSQYLGLGIEPDAFDDRSIAPLSPVHVSMHQQRVDRLYSLATLYDLG